MQFKIILNHKSLPFSVFFLSLDFSPALGNVFFFTDPFFSCYLFVRLRFLFAFKCEMWFHGVASSFFLHVFLPFGSFIIYHMHVPCRALSLPSYALRWRVRKLWSVSISSRLFINGKLFESNDYCAFRLNQRGRSDAPMPYAIDQNAMFYIRDAGRLRVSTAWRLTAPSASRTNATI